MTTAAHSPAIENAVAVVDDLATETSEIDVLVLAAGFEERAFRVLPEGTFRQGTRCILIRYRNDIPGNRDIFKNFRAVAWERFGRENVSVVNLFLSSIDTFEAEFVEAVSRLPRQCRLIGLDVSGMTTHAICTTLKVVRDFYSEVPQVVFYTAAEEYNPTFDEYERLVRDYAGISRSGDMELLPRSMALEMSENVVLDSFAGYRSQNAKSCLAIFAGYEAHRANGVVEAVNPSLLLLLYGRPGDQSLSWRLDLSKRLHRKFEKGRRTATEEVSTLQLWDSLNALEQYYNYLIDDYDLVVAPIGSKMQAVATYLFWERYREIQISFPLPIGYNPDNRPFGVAKTYRLRLSPRRPLFGPE